MEKTTLLEILDAAHLTQHVSGPFPERGGLMLVAPPGSLKTSLLRNVLGLHPDALVLGDINVQTLSALKSDIQIGRYSTLCFTEFPKLYERRQETANNLEGVLRQLVDEGYSKASFEDQRMSASTARAIVLGAMPENFYQYRFQRWNDNGFLRRFLWAVFNIRNQEALMQSISEWERFDLGSYGTRSPGNRSIPMRNTPEEAERIRLMIAEQPGTTTPFILMQKIYAVLRWKYDRTEPGRAMEILEDFAPCLLRSGNAEIYLTEHEPELGSTDEPAAKTESKTAKTEPKPTSTESRGEILSPDFEFPAPIRTPSKVQ